ncbi:hypothetical protein Ddye_012899 [Dipteronia dyeriana]|uniref:Uncharacterized protein n=1 Tax=Dipteronia dyeriana TaxID=168575 RepID=A0AAD9X555_9ROSI|nr:hypothetical protein Ddye_012899 [Dipteronia dyeriana]
MVLRCSKILCNLTPPKFFDSPIDISGIGLDTINNDGTTQVGVGTSKGPERGQKDTSRIHKSPNLYVPPIPFSGRLQKTKLNQAFKEIYDILSKVNVSLPLFEVIEKMPTYAEFFKELNSKACRREPKEMVVISKKASAALEMALQPKLKDLGSFIITISVGETRKEKEMLDLRASTSLMQFKVIESMKNLVGE